MSKKEYKAEFTKDQLLLAILKLTANNNVMLQITLEHLLEVRKSLTAIEVHVGNIELNEKMEPGLNQLLNESREKIKEMIKQSEGSAIREAYEWAFLNDPDSFDLTQFDI